jgi:hypothetical protein
MMSIEFVTKERAKELGMEIRSNPAGPDAVRVVLEFDVKGELKNFTRVDLEIHEAGKLQLSSSLRDESAKPGHVAVSFAADRAKLDQLTLRVVTQSAPRTMTGHDLRVKDFVELKNAAGAAAADEQAQFLAAVRKAFETSDAPGLDALTCWDRVPERQKQNLRTTYASLVADKGALYDFALVDPDPKLAAQDRTEEGVTYRFNLPITKELELKGRRLTDKTLLFVLTFGVGTKEGKLFLVALAPVK